MAAKLEDIRVLAERHDMEVCRDPESWTDYLDTAAKFYRYPFFDTFLIHAQRPEATACAAMPEWNKIMNRWINRGAKGIALIDETGPRLKLRYVFDIKDTHPVQGARKIYLWQMGHKKEMAIRDHIRKTYGISIADKKPMPRVLMALAKHLTGENIRQAMYELNRNRSETYLAGMGEVTLLNMFTKLIEESIAYVLMKRCGYHPLEHIDIGEFDSIRMFDDINVLPYLGEAVHTITEPVLMDIGKVISEIDLEEHRKQIEAAPIKGQQEFMIDGKDVIFEISKDMANEVSQKKADRTDLNEKQEKKHREDIKEDPYGKEEQYRISGEWELPVSEPDTHRSEADRSKEQAGQGDGGKTKEAKGNKPRRVRRADIDRKTAAGEIIGTAIMLPLLPSPEKQKMLARSTIKVKNRTSIKAKLAEKQAEADALNKTRSIKRPRSCEKAAAL